MEIASLPLNPPDVRHEAHDPESGMLVRARDGDMAAFEQLYRRHASRIYAVCLRITAERGAAEECTQDAFLRAWDALTGFRGESRFGTWLTRIAINVALQRLRLEKRQLRLVQPLAGDFLDSLPAPDQAPEHGMDMERLIAGLPPAARAAFVLHAIEGYSHEEIARLTGIAIGTCKAHVHRARQLLQARLQT
ncbi:MAG TPA: RNA polymerase sigma factor [Gammaproteobacteria bacterium]|nr:RNA polymerase sigma factor [Gammaproteobacteria bacterium]